MQIIKKRIIPNTPNVQSQAAFNQHIKSFLTSLDITPYKD